MIVDSTHWDRVYESKSSDRVSWYTPHLARSLDLIDSAGRGPRSAFIDVGGGASTLTSDLLERGWGDVSVLDISAAALEVAKGQLGERAPDVNWIVGDVTEVDLPAARFDVWHDRAVFHFLTDKAQRDAYIEQVRRALKPDGHLILATFGPHGPEKCSGLPVVRYSDVELLDRFGEAFERVRCETESHVTPWGSEQEFVYCLCRRRG